MNNETSNNTSKQIPRLSKRQLTMLGVIGVVAVCFLFVLFNGGQIGKSATETSKPTPVQSANHIFPTPTPLYRTSLLSFHQETATTTAIVIDTGGKAASAVQLEIGF